MGVGEIWAVDRLPYHYRDLEAEEPEAEYEADHDADACSKVLGDVVRVVDTEARKHTADSLEDDSCPDDGVVALEEPVLGDFLPVLHDHPKEKSGEEAVE